MAQFLTTRGLGHQIEEIITTAEVELIIISPFLKFSPSLYERLLYTSRKKITITFICRKKELNNKEEKLLNALNCNIYYKPNLHAKCYINEDRALVSSMNLYEYSETNNEETGILISKKTDAEAFLKCRSYIIMLLENSEPQRVIQQVMDIKSSETEVKFDYEKFKIAWEDWLVSHFKELKYEKKDNYIIFYNYLNKGINISNLYGFITIELPISKEQGKKMKDDNFELLKKKLVNLRCYWSSPFNRIYIYPNDHLPSIEDEIKKCAKAVVEIISYLKRMEIFQQKN